LFHRAEEQEIPLILRHKKEHAVSVRLRSVPTRDSEGAVIETLGLIEPWAGEEPPLGASQDETQDWMQRETKENYKNILEHSGDAIFLADFNTRIVTVNNAGLRLLGHETVDTHRKNIRKKLGIQRKKTNLRTFLASF
jgi:PAS domain-containing protein